MNQWKTQHNYHCIITPPLSFKFLMFESTNQLLIKMLELHSINELHLNCLSQGAHQLGIQFLTQIFTSSNTLHALDISRTTINPE